ncbi:hypothetical protein AB205_0212260 [Aquarana catesbeiana]|uniref:Uncharacterized protein n=1 Tax=Aquarana catesbeiana TaxID=8400 RepID=A0A2G9R4N2_AQUCT|nr:hypothetical protein AB205_0212260 [Aquarana catesbeiana]PIO22817.1 hypothetical protein AB205_0212260 [Aquarana catesbeiana]
MKKMWIQRFRKLVEIVTTTGDVDVVEEETHFNSASAQILISEIMVCNRELEKVKESINDVEKNLTKKKINVVGCCYFLFF